MQRNPLFKVSSVLVLGAILGTLALPAQAQWKWRDAGGKIQYSDLPPPSSTPDKDILQRPAGLKQPAVIVIPFGTTVAASAPAPVASGPGKAELEQQAKQKLQEQELAAKQKEDERKVAQQRRENCGRAQDNLKLLQNGVRLTRPNERGETVVLDERQRAEETQRTRAVIGTECR
ncbi:hypothetical protein BH11PSE10_BH11PSE10_21330 [soil metagenome]